MALLAWKVNRELGWVVRPQPLNDFGIDAHIELIRDGLATGRNIAAQVKAGASQFKEEVDGGWVFRGDAKHKDYWLGHSLPVVVVLCNLEQEICYWREIRADTVTEISQGWKTIVPSAQRIGAAERVALEEVAGRTNRPPVALQVRSFLMEKFSRRIALAPLTEAPRDYHFFEELAEIDGRLVSITFVDLATERLTRDFFEECRRWRVRNDRSAGPVDEVHVYVISHDASTLPSAVELGELGGSDVRTFRLLENEFDLEEVDAEGWAVMWFPSHGPDGEPWRSRRLRED